MPIVSHFLSVFERLQAVTNGFLTAPSYLTSIALDYPLLATVSPFCFAYSKTRLEYIFIFVLSASSFS